MFCRVCNIELTNDNWPTSHKKTNSCICRKCKSEYDYNYRQIHKKERNKKNYEYYNKYKDEINERRRILYQENEEKREIIKIRNKAYSKRSLPELKLKIIEYYSNSTMQCNCCGKKEIKFLQVDHIDCGSNYYGKNKRPHKYTGRTLYKWLIKNNFPEGCQILCANCNFAKGVYGNCPHKKV